MAEATLWSQLDRSCCTHDDSNANDRDVHGTGRSPHLCRRQCAIYSDNDEDYNALCEDSCILTCTLSAIDVPLAQNYSTLKPNTAPQFNITAIHVLAPQTLLMMNVDLTSVTSKRFSCGWRIQNLA